MVPLSKNNLLSGYIMIKGTVRVLPQEYESRDRTKKRQLQAFEALTQVSLKGNREELENHAAAAFVAGKQ
jgi:hypothetical protein